MAQPDHLGTVAATLRHNGKLNLLSPLNQKTPKGEAAGYLTAILYLAPATIAGGKTVCPHSTQACRDGCLFTAGRGRTTRVEQARIRRTRLYLEDRPRFLEELGQDLTTMQDVADRNGLKLAIRLNGTSDIRWELEANGTLFARYPRATFYDYTRTPPQHRHVPSNWRLTYSLADDPPRAALAHLLAGRSVAAVVPDAERLNAPGWFHVAESGGLGRTVTVVDGEHDDLRFLDPAPSLVLLRPKGRLIRGGPMVRHNLIGNLIELGRSAA